MYYTQKIYINNVEYIYDSISSPIVSQNSEVAGLVGNDVWSYKSFPHIPKEKFDIIECFYIESDYKPYRIDLVLTETGLKPIKDIEVGENVFTHKGRLRPVLDKSNHYEEKLLQAKIGTELINCTENHPFYIFNKNEFNWLNLTEINWANNYACSPKLKLEEQVKLPKGWLTNSITELLINIENYIKVKVVPMVTLYTKMGKNINVDAEAERILNKFDVYGATFDSAELLDNVELLDAVKNLIEKYVPKKCESLF